MDSLFYILYCMIGTLYGMKLMIVWEQDHGGERFTSKELFIFAMVMCHLWPVMLVARAIKTRKERNALKAKARRQAARDHALEVRRLRVKELSDKAEEEWKQINADLKAKTQEKIKRNTAEHRAWEQEELRLTEEVYRRINYSGIREARLRARNTGNDREAEMLNRILEDKILDSANNVDFLNALEPDERQKVIARAQQIHRERYGTRFHHGWRPGP